MDHAAHRAARISRQLHSVLGPEQLQALLVLKQADARELCARVGLDIAALRDWLQGSTPVLPGRKLAMLQLLLGHEDGVFSPARVHLLTLDETAQPRHRHVRAWKAIMPLLAGGIRTAVCDAKGGLAWAGRCRVDVVALPNAATVIVRQRRSFGLSRLFGRPLSSQLDELAWGRRGWQAAAGQSRLVANGELGRHLRLRPLHEDDDTCRSLASLYDALARPDR